MSPGARVTPEAASSTGVARKSASTGSATLAVPPPAASIGTSAQDAALVSMAPTPAHWLSEYRAATLLRAEGWKYLLECAGLADAYPSIVEGIRDGFRIGFPIIYCTHAPPNSVSLYEQPNIFNNIIAHEFEMKRFLGPFSRNELESLIGPFQSSPLSLIPKPHKPESFRMIQNFSFPCVPTPPLFSVNYGIDANNYPCTWGTFTIVALMVWSLPPGSQGAVRDVAEAYRTVPLHPTQWAAAVVRLAEADRFAINTCTAFGGVPNAGVYGNLADAGLDIMRSKGLGPMVRWVDDHVFIRLRIQFVAQYNALREVWRQSVEAWRGDGSREATSGLGATLSPMVGWRSSMKTCASLSATAQRIHPACPVTRSTLTAWMTLITSPSPLASLGSHLRTFLSAVQFHSLV